MGGTAFGIFDHLERRGESLEQLYEGRLRLLETADAAGFYGYHLAEHHATPLGMAPSPGIFLSAVAQRTRRLRFGPLVYLLPLYNPLRLIAEICMLDQLSGGRLEVGVGRGISPFELAYHGVPFIESRDMFEEALDILVAGLRERRLSHRGEHYRYTDVPMELSPKQVPNPPFWYGVSTPQSVLFAAQRGMHMVGGGPIAGLKKSVEAYREARERHKHSPENVNPQVSEPKIGAIRHCYVAETDRDADAVARPAYRVFFNNLVKLWRDFRTTPMHFTDDLEIARKGDAVIVGSPSTVRDEVARFFEHSGCNYLVLSFAWGDLTQEQSQRSLDLFASKVMPEFTKL
ncbi:MAG TPA: LLM class flavin-dependent oxidoreductase [Candidatus Binatia bacterium]|jgi:alkanesulfonate monooxygenase SsuD/methylene tetrahydromethanopterin reductase-like flavin-dependent oxidoreductase (luciferase family)|nr:LLM class flavin-dependent oxidoreductase [Candidatus Binatia bacterium]